MFIVALAYLAFVSLALPPSMLGVVWPSMRLSFGQPLSAVGLVPPVGVIAGLISTSLAPYSVKRIGVGRLLALGTFLSVASLGVSAMSTTMWQFLGGVVLGGWHGPAGRCGGGGDSKWQRIPQLANPLLMVRK